jgi:3-hydroxy-3-methylglutaryl CoA synthase
LFSERIGFKAYYNKTYYAVKFPDFLNKDKHSRLPQVTKRLIRDCYFSSVKSGVKKPKNKPGG